MAYSFNNPLSFTDPTGHTPCRNGTNKCSNPHNWDPPKPGKVGSDDVAEAEVLECVKNPLAPGCFVPPGDRHESTYEYHPLGPTAEYRPLGQGVWVKEIRFDFGKVDWLDVIVNVIGIGGDLSLIPGQWEVWGVTEIVEVVGVIKDLQDAQEGDTFGLAMDVLQIIFPGYGSLFNVLDIGHNIFQGVYVQTVFYEFKNP